jgi:hypothetical protein
MKIHQMLDEMQTWFSPSQELLDKANQSKITTKNNNTFKQLVEGWEEGMFDENPRLIYDEITFLLEQ